MLNKIRNIMLFSALLAVAVNAEELVRYEFYEPESAEYEVSPDVDDDGFGYNGKPSVEYFEDSFYVAWQANAGNNPEQAGRRIYVSTSENLINWTKPIDFLVRQTINPFVPSVISGEKQGYPVLYNHNDEALWCFWCVDGLPSEMTNAGLYLSVLEAGSKLWYSSKIFEIVRKDDDKYYAIPTQKPVHLESGKFVLPVRLCKGGVKDGREHSLPAFLVSSDGGESWELDSTTSMPENESLSFQTTVHQQVDETLRIFSLPDYRNNLPVHKRLLTGTASGTKLGDTLEPKPDLVSAQMETASGNLSVTKLPTGRYAMIIGDIYAEVNGPNLCYNPAIFFSRTGGNDFIGGYPFLPGEEISSAQATAHNGRLYIAYSQNIGTDKPSEISLKWVEMPQEQKRYIYPKCKDVLTTYDTEYVRSRKGGGFLRRKNSKKIKLPSTAKDGERNVIIFQNNSAAIETEPVKLENDESVEVSLSVKITALQDAGELTFFTVGDLYPASLVMPSARDGEIYVRAPGVYEKIASKERGEWFLVNAVLDEEKLQIKIDEGDPVELDSRLLNQKFYIGSNHFRYSSESNEGSVFSVDIDSVSSKSNRKKMFIEY